MKAKKNRNFLLVILVTFSVGMVMAQCNVRNIQLNGSTHFAYTGDKYDREYSYTIFKLKMKETDVFNNIVLENLSLDDESKLKVYTSDPCDGTLNATKTFTIVKGMNTFNIGGNYSNDIYLKIINKDIGIKSFRISVEGRSNNINECDKNANLYNSIDNPTIVELSSLQNSICIKSCTKNTRKFKPLPRSRSYYTNWFELSFFDKAFIDMKLNANANEKQRLSIYGVQDDQKILIYNEESSKSIDVNYLSVYRFNKILIGVGAKKRKGLDINLCLDLYENKETCVDYFGGGDTLIVVSTSKGSDFEGPFLPGEEVVFCYKMMDWAPVNYNYLHALTLTYGKGWDVSFLDSKTLEPKSYMLEGDEIFIKNCKERENDTLDVPGWQIVDTSFVDGVKTGVFAGKGWYFGNSIHGPKGPAKKFHWADHFSKVRGTFEKPLVEIFFTLKTQTKCEGIADCNVGIQPHSDYTTGRYLNSGCYDNKIQELIRIVDCCDDRPELLVQDDKVCNGNKVQFNIESEYDFSWKSDGLNSKKGVAGIVNDIAINTTDSTQVASIMFISTNPSRTCIDTLISEFTVYPSPNYDVPDQLDYCNDKQLSLIVNQDNLKEEYSYDWYNTNLRNGHLTGKEISFAPDDVDRELLLLVKTKYNCVDSSRIQLNLRDKAACEKDETALSFVLTPNPTIGSTTLIITNMTEDPNLKCRIFNKELNKVFEMDLIVESGSVGRHLIDFRSIASGTYTITLSNAVASSGQKLVKIND